MSVCVKVLIRLHDLKMNKTFFYLTISLLVACNQAPQDQQNEEPNGGAPRRATTTFGQSVEKAEDLSDATDERNEEIEKQAEDLFGDS